MNKIEIVNDKIVNSSILINNKKIVIEEDMKLNIDLKNSNIKLNIIIKDNIRVQIFEYGLSTDLDISYSIGKNSSLDLNRFYLNSNIKTSIIQKENSILNNNYSCISLNDNSYQIDVKNKKNSISNITNHGINLKDKLEFIVNGIIGKNDTNVISNQNSSIILFEDSKGKILPNFIIDNNDVVANHSSYLGEFKEKEMFYLKARGIEEKTCYKMLARAFLLGNMNLECEDINRVLMILDDFWR
jgi:hypothetical protein